MTPENTETWRIRFDKNFADREVGYQETFGDYQDFDETSVYSDVLLFIEEEIDALKGKAMSNERALKMSHQMELDALSLKSTESFIDWSKQRKLQLIVNSTRTKLQSEWRDEFRNKFTVLNENSGTRLVRYTDADSIETFITTEIERAVQRGYRQALKEVTEDKWKTYELIEEYLSTPNH